MPLALPHFPSTLLYLRIKLVEVDSIRNIGILAHVDAGKTSLTENLLFAGGVTRTMGSVDRGTALTDSLAVERQRGVSVRSAANTLMWKGHQINLIDTPGHTDFFGEVDRVLSVLDAAIILVSTVEGLQSSLYLLTEALRYYQVPVMLFLNKIDRPGSDFEQIVDQLDRELGLQPFVVNEPRDEGSSDCQINHSPEAHLHERNMEAIADLNESFLNQYLEGHLPDERTIQNLIARYTSSRQLCPVFSGSAKYSLGITELLDGIIDYLPPAKSESTALSGRVFKIEFDKVQGRLVHVRLFSGELKTRDLVFNQRLNKTEKVSQIKRCSGNKLVDIGSLTGSDIGVICGFTEAHPGDVIGDQDVGRAPKTFQEPVLQTKIKPVQKAQTSALAQALEIMTIEDPLIGFEWYRKEDEMVLKLMGAVQEEIVLAILEERFQVEASCEATTVIYKETPLTRASGYVEYTMPKPCWAVMIFEIEPLPAGSGVVYESTLSVDKIHRKYQNEVEETVPIALKQGIKGWEVTDVKITLVEGEDHTMHSRPGDFILATPMGVLRALEKAGSTLLEPMYDYTLHFLEGHLGAVTSELTKIRASFEPPIFDGEEVRLNGQMPVATSQDFPLKLNSLSSGRGRIRLQFGGYQPCADEDGETRAYRGVNPLDESLWILHKRGAYKSHER